MYPIFTRNTTESSSYPIGNQVSITQTAVERNAKSSSAVHFSSHTLAVHDCSCKEA